LPSFLPIEVSCGSKLFLDLKDSLNKSSLVEEEKVFSVIVTYGFVGTVFIFGMSYDLENVPIPAFTS